MAIVVKKPTSALEQNNALENTFSDSYLPSPLLWHTLQTLTNSLSWVLTTYALRKLMAPFEEVTRTINTWVPYTVGVRIVSGSWKPRWINNLDLEKSLPERRSRPPWLRASQSLNRRGGRRRVRPRAGLAASIVVDLVLPHQQ